jgi:hypothetical protein
MNIDKLPSYHEVIKYLDKQKRPKHLLLGNGFSMAYDSKIFSYNALSTFIEKTNNPLLQKLFSTIKTRNFEQIMQQLDNFSVIAEAFNADKRFVDKIKIASSTLKSGLIEAVKELHPEHVFIVPEEKSKKCSMFLEEYLSKGGKIFSTNYDLLLYWVLMRNNSKNATDGFGRDLENTNEYINEEDLEFSELRWGKYKDDQTIFYLHGALPIFDTGINIVKEEYDTQNYLLEKINSRMENKEYPIFVTAGNAKEKLNHIMHNKYLSFCYDEFSALQGSLIILGFNFGNYDLHIIDAINKAAHYGRNSANKLRSIYIGVYSDTDLVHIEKIEDKFKVKVKKYNARSVNIWD